MIREKWYTDSVAKVVDGMKYPKATEDILNYTVDLEKEHHIYPTELQITVLANHLGEMITRSKTNEALMDVDPKMFSEVSEESMAIAQAVTARIGNLASSEPYVLSIHFEAAKENQTDEN